MDCYSEKTNKDVNFRSLVFVCLVGWLVGGCLNVHVSADGTLRWRTKPLDVKTVVNSTISVSV